MLHTLCIYPHDSCLHKPFHVEQRDERECVQSVSFLPKKKKKEYRKAVGNAALLRLRGTKGSTCRETR